MNHAKPNRWSAPDLADFERENDELNQALWRAFAPIREDDSTGEIETPDRDGESDSEEDRESDGPTRFELEVQAKIAAQEKRIRQAPGFARKAAVFLPPFMLPKALAPMTATGTKSSAAFVPGLAALPALALATLLFSGFTFLRYVFHKSRHAPQADDQLTSELEIRAWWRANIWKTLLVFTCLFCLAIEKPLEAVVLSLTISSIALFGLLTALASAGYASRREVGRVAYQFLYIAAVCGWQFIQNDAFGLQQQIGHAWVIPLLIVATATCFGLIHGKVKAWFLAATVAALAIGGIRFFDNHFGRQPLNLEGAIEIMSDPRYSGRSYSVASWDEYAKAQQHLRAAGRDMPDWFALKACMQRTLQAGLEAEDFNSLYALDMMEAEALRAEDVPALQSEYKWEHMFDPQKAYSLRSEDVQVRMRLLATVMSADEKLAVAERILKEILSGNERLNLEDMMIGVRTLELLGFANRVPELKPLAHSLLRAHWQTTRDGMQGNFVSYPSFVKRDEQGRMSADRLMFGSMAPTGVAVEAIRRWGTPEGIDLKALHAYLKVTARTHRPNRPTGYALLAESARLNLESMTEYQAVRDARVPTHPWDWFLMHRLLLASLLLAVGGVWSTWHAPR